MKKENSALLVFLLFMALVVGAGIIAGRNDVFSAVTAAHRPWVAPVLACAPAGLAVSALGLVMTFVKYRHRYRSAPRLAEYTAIYTYTLFAVLASGFYRLYSLENLVTVAASLIVAVVIVILAAVLQFTAQKGGIFHTDTAVCAVLLMCCIAVSLFLPLGPVPGAAVGALWLWLAYRHNKS